MLAHQIGQKNWQQVLVFTRTKHGADRLAKQLEQDGLHSTAIHGRKTQGARTRALADFKAGRVRVLVATDVAARGLDIDRLPHVVNYELPDVPEDYVHRVGRTARAGAVGTAVTFVTARDLGALRTLENHLGRTLPRERLEGFDYSGAPPAEEEVADRRHSRSPRGVGSKSADDLSPEELEKLLNFG